MKTLILPQRALQPFIFSPSALRNLKLMLFLYCLFVFLPFTADWLCWSHCLAVLGLVKFKADRHTFSGHSRMNYFSLWIPSTLFCPITFLSAVINLSSNQLYNLPNNSAP